MCREVWIFGENTFNSHLNWNYAYGRPKRVNVTIHKRAISGFYAFIRIHIWYLCNFLRKIINWKHQNNWLTLSGLNKSVFLAITYTLSFVRVSLTVNSYEDTCFRDFRVILNRENMFNRYNIQCGIISRFHFPIIQ